MIRGEQRRVWAFSALAVLNHTVTAIMTMPIFPLLSFGFPLGFILYPPKSPTLRANSQELLVFLIQGFVENLLQCFYL